MHENYNCILSDKAKRFVLKALETYRDKLALVQLYSNNENTIAELDMDIGYTNAIIHEIEEWKVKIMEDPKADLLFTDITLERIRELAPEAFKEAIVRYPSDVEGALIFFVGAIGLGTKKPTVSEIGWAQDIMKKYG